MRFSPPVFEGLGHFPPVRVSRNERGCRKHPWGNVWGKYIPIIQAEMSYTRLIATCSCESCSVSLAWQALRSMGSTALRWRSIRSSQSCRFSIVLSNWRHCTSAVCILACHAPAPTHTRSNRRSTGDVTPMRSSALTSSRTCPVSCSTSGRRSSICACSSCGKRNTTQWDITQNNAKFFPSHKARRAALMSVSLALSRTPVYTARP